MILLDGHSLTPAMVVPVEQMSLQLKERDSTATMTPASMESITVNSWLKDDRDPGSGIVWRIRSIQYMFDTRTPKVQLEHVISLLKDKIMFGEITPATITGTTGATTCTAKQAIQYILGQQSDWTLGEFAAAYENISNPYKFNSENLYAALETVTGSLEDAWWTYDMSVYPFELNIVQHSDDVASEMRAGRNLQTISRTIDRSGMFTRFYPIGKNNLHISNGYVEKNTASYGVVSKVETDMSLATEAELTAWANQELDRHAEPMVTVTADGFELSKATGEPLDALTIGRVCRIPLPEFDTTIQERIVEISWQDKVNKPESVKVTLANSRVDVTKIIAEEIRRGGGGRRAAAVKEQEDHAWFVDTDDHVAMVAEGIIGVDEHGNPDWGRLSTFIADGEGLKAKVETSIEGVTDRVATLEISESEIRSEVAASNSQIYTTIQQTASGIRTEIANTSSGLYAYVDQTASYFRQTYINRTNKTWIQDTDPTIGGAEPREGDVWVESTSQGTWDGAEGFDWEHDEDYDWLQVQGAKIWGWKNDKWELVSDQQQVVTMTDVEQTSEHIVQRAIRVLVNDDGNLSVYRAELLVEGDRIRSEVYEAISGMGSTIEQTASAIRSEVHAAQSSLYSFILQTASAITIRVGESNMVFTGTEKPEGTEDHPLVEGDLWLESTFQRTWADMEELDAWIDDEDFDWGQMRGSKLHVYDAELGDFKEALDETVLADDADIVDIGKEVGFVARSVKKVDNKVDVYRAEFKVRADQIVSSVNQRLAGIGSTITQTASEIRAEVHAANSQIYSSITQTASQIRAEVVDSLNNVNSSITQQANRISLVVEGTGSNAHIKPASIVTAINESGSSVTISASKVLLSGSTTINDVMTIGSNHVNITLPTRIQGEVMAETLTLRSGSSAVGISQTDLAGVIKKATVSGNTLTLTPVSGNAITFSKAVSSWTWAGGDGQVKVTAHPQNQTLGVDVAVSGDSRITSNGTYTFKVQYEDSEGSYWDTGASKSVVVDIPTRTDKGSSWYCTVTQQTSGGKSCTLTKNFAAGQTVPFSNGSSYHLYV